MPLLGEGIYSNTGEQAYEKESSYYLNFQLKSALVSMEYINKEMKDISMFENECQYYHFYTDHILYSIGQISNRFIIGKNDKNNLKERKQMNKINFSFTEEKFPVLSKKLARNTIEHIDEHNQNIIDKLGATGGFNIITKDTDKAIQKELREKWKNHPYLLDLLERKIRIVRKEEIIYIELDKLREELELLKKNVEEFEYISN